MVKLTRVWVQGSVLDENCDKAGYRIICPRENGGYLLFEFLKNLLSRSSMQSVREEPLLEPEFQTKPCRSCGRPISYNPEWKHILAALFPGVPGEQEK